MNILQSPHFQDFKVVLSLLGQWPSQSRLQRYSARFFVLFAIFSILTPKVIKFVEVMDDIDGIIACLPMIFVHLTSLTKYFNWIINTSKFDHLIFLIERDGQTLEVNQDVEIMDDWLRKIKSISTTYTTSMFGILGVFLISPAFPKVLDIINPLNESRPLLQIYETEYFVDENEYYLYILLHAYMTVPISMGVLIYFDILLGTHVYHACAMFEILRTYLKTIHVEICDEQVEVKDKSKKIIHCVRMHRTTLEFADEIDSAYSTAWFIMLITCLVGLTFTGTAVRLIIIDTLPETNEAIKYVSFCLGHAFHLYFTSFQGQLLIDNSEAVFYDTLWYRIPIFYQKLLITIMMRSMNPCRISAGKVYILAKDTFSSVMQKSMSFFTVLSSMR
ncbi:GSCOCT00006529001.3-RA-CDS, partial [Cotesia congregata]